MFSSAARRRRKFMELTRPHLKLLYNMALRYTGRSEDAEDLLQETLYSAFKNLRQLREVSSLKGWLISIMRNRHIRESQRTVRRAEVELDEGRSYLSALEAASAMGDPEGLVIGKLESSRLQAILDRLPEKYRTAVILSCVEGLSYREISEAMNMPIGTVMSSISRGKAHVKREILRASMEEAGSVLSIMERIKEKG